MFDDTSLIDPRALMGGFVRDCYYPPYRSGSSGLWTLRVVAMAACRGYWGEVYPLDGTAILCGPSEDGAQSWMSLTPSEIESQEIGLAAAHGHTVVMGMGMGWLAANVALRPEVKRLTVVERDPAILSLIEEMGVFSRLPAEAQAKVTIVQADALEWRPDCPVDSLQVDIWRKFVEDHKLADMRRIQDNVGAKEIYFWGQEMEFWRYACRRAGNTPDLNWPKLHQIIDEDIRLPLIVPDWPDYPQKIAAGAPWWTPKNPEWWR